MPLSTQSYDAACSFLRREARPLEQALFSFETGAGSPEAVWEELAEFRNEDGGFGHGLEPDLRLPASSTLATSQALVHLRETGATAANPLVRGAVAWLRDAYDPDLGAWRSVPREAEDFPHAGHWAWALHDDGKKWPVAVLPRAEVLASLHAYASEVPSEWLAALSQRFIEDLTLVTHQAGGDALVGCDGLVRSHATPSALRSACRTWMLDVGPKMVQRDEAEWSSYVVKPLKIAPWPDSVLAEVLADDIARNLDYEIRSQESDGSWSPNWSWNGSYPADWERARKEWQGILTRERLSILRAWGQIAT